MENIFIRNVKTEVVTFIDRQAAALSKISKRRITRNEYINLILEKQLRDDLALDDKLDRIDTKVDLLADVIKEDRQATDRLIGLIVHGDDINEE